MTMKKICTLPIIAALLLCGCSKEMTVIPQADTPSETADETAAKQTQPAETTETQAQTSSVSETIITADIPIDDDIDIFEDNEFTDNSADIADITDEELTDNTMTVTVMSVSENGFMAALSQDTFFGKKNDEVSIGLPYDHPEI